MLLNRNIHLLQVFINGEFIGGCDDTLDAYDSGKLTEKLSAVGITVQS